MVKSFLVLVKVDTDELIDAIEGDQDDNIEDALLVALDCIDGISNSGINVINVTEVQP